jgi:hypothetical protein
MQLMRPMSFGEILDGAFKIYRSHFMPMFLSALISYAPFMLIGAAVAMAAGAGDNSAGMAAAGLTMLISIPLMVLGFGVSWGSVTHLTSEAYLGRPVTLGGGLGRGLRRALPLFGALIVAGFLMMLGFLFFIVPGFIVMAMLFAVFPAVVVENRGPIAALGRSRELARGSLGRILGVVFVAALIASLPNYAVTIYAAATGAGSIETASSTGAFLGTQALSLLLSALAAPFSTAVTVLLYYDRRIRSEGLDVQMMAEGIPAFA